MKKSIVIYDAWGELIKNLPDDVAGVLIKMVCQYSFDGNAEPSGNDVIDAMFFMIRAKLDADADAYDEAIKKKSEAGKKGMKKRWDNNKDITDDNTVITKDNTVKKSITKITDNVYVYDNDNVNNNINNPYNPLDGFFADEELNLAFNKYIEICRNGKKVDFQAIQRKLYDLAKGDVKTMIQILEQSITQGWSGLYELKAKEKPKDKIHFENERSYDFDALEKRLKEKQSRKARDG